MIGVALIGYPFLYQNGDQKFHLDMVKLGLSRGSSIRCGLPNELILANSHEYWLNDCDEHIAEFCERFKFIPTYTPEDFIETIKKELEKESKNK